MPNTETTIGEAPSEENLNLHIYMTKEGYEKVKDRADYAAIGGIIERHPSGELFELLQLRPSDIGEIIGENALNTGKYPDETARSSLVQKGDRKNHFMK